MVFEDIVPAALSAKRAGMVVCGVRANDPRQDVEGLMRASDLWLDDWSSIPC
jgi:beta-phosphoglucomutase-like phosphatase (HAD superfamily)